MSILNEIQRDFLKQSNRLLFLLRPYKEDFLIRSLNQEIQNASHTIHFTISGLTKKRFSNLQEILSKVDLPNFSIQFSDGKKDRATHSIRSDFHFILPAELDKKLNADLDQTAYLILVDDGDDEPLQKRVKYTNQVSTLNLSGEDDIQKWLVHQEFFIKHIFKSKELFLQSKIKAIDKYIGRKLAITKGQQILNKSQELNVSLDQKKKWQRHFIQIKSRLSSQIKKQFQSFEENVHLMFNPNIEVFKEIYTEINNYRGFDEQDDSRNTLYSIPSEYLSVVKAKLRNGFSHQIDLLKGKIEQINESVQEAVNSSKEIAENLTVPVFKKDFVTDAIYQTIDREEVAIKKYEKSVPKKGIYQLLMELRTPLYIIFPLFIIARFINTSDEGIINHQMTTLSGEPVVVISQLPESYNNNEQNFIAALSKQLNTGELLNQSTGEEIFKYRTDKRGLRKEALYYLIPDEQGNNQIALPIESDRILAINLLETGLLKISKRFNVIKELQKIPLIFGPFRKLFGPTVLILIVWYIRSRRDSMKREKETIRYREQHGLINELSRDIGKLTNTVETSFMNQLKTYSRSLIEEFSHGLEMAINKKVKNDEKDAVQRLKLIKERDLYFQKTIKEFTQTSKHILEVSRALNTSNKKS